MVPAIAWPTMIVNGWTPAAIKRPSTSTVNETELLERLTQSSEPCWEKLLGTGARSRLEGFSEVAIIRSQMIENMEV